MFQARDFTIRDGDTVYITEAPFVRWQRTLSAVTGTLTPLANAATIADRISPSGQ
jgi:polysaccharide export outer membrane protein